MTKDSDLYIKGVQEGLRIAIQVVRQLKDRTQKHIVIDELTKKAGEVALGWTDEETT